MAVSSELDADAKILALQHAFKQKLVSEIDVIERAWQIVSHDVDSSKSSLQELYEMADSLAGSSGSFGASELSAVARELEGALDFLFNEYDKALHLSSDIQQQITELFIKLRQAADKWQPSALSYIQSSDSDHQGKKHLIYLSVNDELLATDLIDGFSQTSFQFQRFTELADFQQACKQQSPDAIIMEVDFIDEDVVAAKLLPPIIKKMDAAPSVIFISARDDIKARLESTRSGAQRYFTKPLKIRHLISALDNLKAESKTESCRVLLVDDDESLMEYHAIVLREAGMDVETLSQPLQGLEVLAEFKPDIVVMDVYMPECSGPELAQIIRQDDKWSFMPIMFLSGEQGLERQLSAMSLGGDDFLVKPVDAGHLVSSILSRVKRARRSNHLNNELKIVLRESKFQLATMDEHDIVSTTDVTGKITSVNKRFCQISGYSAEELLGQNHRMLKSGVHPKSFYVDMWKTVSQGKIWRGTICNRKKNGDDYWVESTIVPFIDDRGKPYKYVSARTDVTALRRSEDRLNRSQVFANIGTWDWNIINGDLYWSDRIGPLFGYNKKNIETTYDNFLSAVHEDDRQGVIDAVNDCVERGAKYNIEHRVVWPDGSVHWVQESGDVVRSEDGKPLHMLGVVQDINARKHAELKLADREQQLSKYNETLELIAKGGQQNDVLQAVIEHAETMLGGGICSILLLDHSGKYLSKGIAPGLPDFYNKAIDGLEIGMGVGSCGESAFSGKRVIASDLMVHPNWIVFRDVVKKAGLHACWSEPIFASSGNVLGTFAIYYTTPREPTAVELKLTMELAQFVAIVVERHQSQQALINSKEEAEDANRAKSQFLSSMSHELRTPMNAILGFSQLLKMEADQLSESQDENVDEILKAGNHLLALINEVLDLAKIEAGRIELSIETIELNKVISESLQLISPLASKRGIEIKLLQDGADIEFNQLSQQRKLIRADHTRLRQVLLNLLSNAVKYNRPNGKIFIDCHNVDEDQIRVSVTDTGDGLTPEQQTHLFKAFNRLSEDQAEIEGTGIGLVITKNIVELMGGSIGLDSESGKGSTFWIELPIGGLHAIYDSKVDEMEAKDKSLTTASEYEHNVLYIEDNPANLRLVSQLLGSRSNIHMWSAHEPVLGLELAAEHNPDLILLDINLPGMDGFEVLAHLRKQEATRDTAVIAISANAMPKDIEMGMAAGFDDYITKPIDIKALLHAVDEALAGSQK